MRWDATGTFKNCARAQTEQLFKQHWPDHLFLPEPIPYDELQEVLAKNGVTQQEKMLGLEERAEANAFM